MSLETYTSTLEPLGKTVTYSLLRDEGQSYGPMGYEVYGVKVDMDNETASRPRLTVSRNAVGSLLRTLAKGCVTPIALDDVVDDWLAY
jgi:hypothetical protein